MGRGGLLIIAVFGVVSWYGYACTIRFAAERATVAAPNGRSYHVLVNPDGVTPYSKAAGWANALSPVPGLIGVWRRRGGRTGWVVRVRPSPFNGYADLVHEVLPDRERARQRASEVEELIRRGGTLWPADAEWFR